MQNKDMSAYPALAPKVKSLVFNLADPDNKVTHLDLSGNKLYAEAVESLAGALAKPANKLKHLNLEQAFGLRFAECMNTLLPALEYSCLNKLWVGAFAE